MIFSKKKVSKFEFKDDRSFKEKAINFGQSLLFWVGRKKGYIHTINITLDDIRAVFFPLTFHEKYRYLGSVPWREAGEIFKAMEPLVIFMDHKAKPWWCPRWFLRFLHLFGSDNSIVRVRNRYLHDLEKYITKGYMIWDFKTKWQDYDLRISVNGTSQMQTLADSIEREFYDKGYRQHLYEQILELDPNTKFHSGYLPETLELELRRLGGLNEF